MSRVVLVTDSTATLPDQQVNELGISVVPVLLVIGGRVLRDGEDISPSEVYCLLRDGAEIPTSTAPSVGDFLRTFVAAGKGASGVVSIHMPPSLSTTYNVALTASELQDAVSVRVVDSGTAAMGQGFAVLEAARAAAAGASLDSVVARAQAVDARVQVVFTLDTFKYLQRGGRIGGAAALLGTVLQIKPELHLAQGRVEVLARPRTKPRALRYILTRMADHVGEGNPHVAVFHADVPDEAEALRRTVAEQFECAELFVTEFTPVMGAHTGPGLIGLAYYTDPEP